MKCLMELDTMDRLLGLVFDISGTKYVHCYIDVLQIWVLVSNDKLDILKCPKIKSHETYKKDDAIFVPWQIQLLFGGFKIL